MDKRTISTAGAQTEMKVLLLQTRRDGSTMSLAHSQRASQLQTVLEQDVNVHRKNNLISFPDFLFSHRGLCSVPNDTLREAASACWMIPKAKAISGWKAT